MKRKHTLANNYPIQLKVKFLARCAKYNLPGDPDECWEWLGSKAFYNYGTILYEKGIYRTHRVAWEVWKGTIPEDKQVLHHCDNPCCVNPGHLFLGTQDDNMKDKMMKGRGGQLKGEEQGNSKLTNKQIKRIRQLWQTGKYYQREIGERFNIAQPTVCRIVSNVTWKSIK